MTARGAARQVPARQIRPGDFLVLEVQEVAPTPDAVGDWLVARVETGGTKSYLSWQLDDIVDIERPEPVR